MQTSQLEEKISELLAAKLSEPEFSDCFALEIHLSPKKKLDIFLDSDIGITFAKCQRISRYLEHHIDTEGWLGEDYTLEVSSPGASRPLVNPRQYPKHIGRILEIYLPDQTLREGKLLEVGNDFLKIEETIVGIEGKKKTKEVRISEIPFDQIKKTLVKISF